MDFSQHGTEKLVTCCDRCLTCDTGCLKVQWDSSTWDSELFILELKISNPKYMHFKLIFRKTVVIQHV